MKIKSTILADYFNDDSKTYHWKVHPNNDLAIGDMVIITEKMPGEPDPLEIGDAGIVYKIVDVSGFGRQIHVDWESARSLILLGSDPFIALRMTMSTSETTGFVVEY